MTVSTPRRRTKRPTLTADELRVWRDFIETADALRAELASRLQSESGLSTGDYAVLLALSEAPDRRRRSSDLADRGGVGQQRPGVVLRHVAEGVDAEHEIRHGRLPYR